MTHATDDTFVGALIAPGVTISVRVRSVAITSSSQSLPKRVADVCSTHDAYTAGTMAIKRMAFNVTSEPPVKISLSHECKTRWPRPGEVRNVPQVVGIVSERVRPKGAGFFRLLASY